MLQYFLYYYKYIYEGVGMREEGGWHFVLIGDFVVEIVPEIDTNFNIGSYNGKECFPTFYLSNSRIVMLQY